MASADKIIDKCLLAIGEDVADLANPVNMTRADVLELINNLYRNDIGERAYQLATYSYDASDGEHTITAGVGNLPSDFLLPHFVYDGDAPTNDPLEQIFEIEDKVANDATTSQYMLPDNTHLWIFGQTPTNTIKMYYYTKPAALEDSATSYPVALLEQFHYSVFEARVKQEYAIRLNNTEDENYQRALVYGKGGYLDQIDYAHKTGKRDGSPQLIKME